MRPPAPASDPDTAAKVLHYPGNRWHPPAEATMRNVHALPAPHRSGPPASGSPGWPSQLRAAHTRSLAVAARCLRPSRIGPAAGGAGAGPRRKRQIRPWTRAHPAISHHRVVRFLGSRHGLPVPDLARPCHGYAHLAPGHGNPLVGRVQLHPVRVILAGDLEAQAGGGVPAGD
jgi:hypothetical protein